MQLKANFHFHVKEDPSDSVSYNLIEGINHAVEKGFDVLAVTCHNYFAWTSDHAEYAKNKGILLLPGIELTISEKKKITRRGRRRGGHVVIINPDKSAEKIHTFQDLSKYRESHPDIVVIAAHPYFYGSVSLKKNLEKYIHLFDAIEHSWFYSKRFFNRNKKAIHVSLESELPLIATSDTHFFNNEHMNKNYAILDLDEKTIPSVIRAIKNGDFENVTKPSSFWRDMLLRQFFLSFIKGFYRAIGKIQ